MTYINLYSAKSLSTDISANLVNRLLGWLDTSDENIVETTVENRYEPDTKRYFYVSPSYKRTERKAFNSQRDCAEAWADRQFPTHNVDRNGEAELYSSENFRGIQFPDGRGRLIHYRTTAAIRTKNGQIIGNSQDWGTGFATVTHPRDTDYSLPLDALQGVFTDDEDMYDIQNVHRDRGFNGFHSAVTLVEMPDGGIVLGSDASTKQGEPNTFAFRVSDAEISEARNVSDLLDLLKPQPVAVAEAKGMTVVPVNRLTSHDVSDDVADRMGESIIQRQGEWFFIPEPDADPNGSVRKVLTDGGDAGVLDAHEPRDMAPGLEAACPACEASSWHADPDGPWTCEACETPAMPLVRGTVRHRRNEHYMARLGETWHRAVTHNREVQMIDTSAGRSGGGRRFD